MLVQFVPPSITVVPPAEAWLRSTFDCFPAVYPEDLPQQFNTEQLLEAALSVLNEAVQRVRRLEDAVNCTSQVLSEWTDLWGISEAAIDDLNKRFVDWEED